MVVTRYVNTASTPGGDGTTNATSGDNRAFASLNEAEASIPATISDWWDIICEGSAADTAAVTLSGTTTTADYYIQIRTDPEATYGRHDGTYPTTKYRLETTNANGISNTNLYVRIDGLAIKTNTSSTTYIYCINNSGSGTAGIQISNCICTTINNSNDRGGIRSTSAITGGTIKIWNCILYGFTQAYSTWSGGVFNSAGATVSVYNVTVYNTNVGIRRLSGTMTAINCAVGNNTDDFNGTITIDHCASDDGDGTNPVVPSDWTTVFVDVAGDYHLKSTDTDLMDAGTNDPGSGLFSDDIDGETRSGTWDIGADEYVSGGYTMPADSGSLTLAGTAVGLLAARKIPVASGSLSLAGTAVGTLKGSKIAVSSGSLVLAGTDVGLLADRIIAAASGSIALAGTDVGLLALRKLIAASGAIALTGTDVDLIYTPAGEYVIVASSGSLSLAGTDVGLKATRNIPIASGSLTLSGSDVGTLKGSKIAVASGTLNLTGTGVDLYALRKLIAESGALILTGTAVGLEYSAVPFPLSITITKNLEYTISILKDTEYDITITKSSGG